MKHSLCLIAALLLVSCGKEEPKSEPKAKATTVSPKPTVPEKKLPPVPQGELQRMDPEKAKFIAIPNTPKDPEVKKVVTPATEEKKAAAPVTEIKKVAPPAAETKKAEEPAPEVKKAAPAAQQ